MGDERVPGLSPRLPPRHGGYRAPSAAIRLFVQPNVKAIKPPSGKGGGSPEKRT